MKRLAKFAVAALIGSAAVPAMSAEVLNVPFAPANSATSTGLYSGTIKVRVSGTGFSLGNDINDAFYLVNGPTHDPSYYQLTFGLAPLVPFNPSQNAVNFIVGGLPAYQASHVYTFLLNTGTATPSQLNFGVGDGNFGDNGGAFTVALGVPEPAAWGLMIAGFGVVGFASRRRRSVRCVTA